MPTNNKQNDGYKQIRSKHLFFKIAELSPAYFALVMATGIVSIAAHLYNYILFAKALFYINSIAYLIICILFIFRFIYFKKEFLSDFMDDRKNMGFLSFVAANCILGGQFILIANNYHVAAFFLIIGLSSWIVLTYSLFLILIEKRNKPSIKAINGTWLLLVVATQAVSILLAQLEEFLPFSHNEVLFFSLILFLCGCLFYIILITLIIYRLIFFELHAEDLSPPFWISMGADAITVLAGSTLILNADKWELLIEILPFLKGFTLLFWAIGTWWIPLMVMLGIWRHFIKKVPLKYNSAYWGMVFPLGMYTVCTFQLSQAVGVPFLMAISSVFVFFAIGVWSIVFIYLIYSLIFSVMLKKKL
ncbi:C4-dicarboxylate ABC transporter [Kaistella flava (ex Peng et al. 2021)]|uniref:C4-dicarboxylate ABC transporter n=1 Tax=Kaistella flava (ex Peng et al. 2021) TaxID=2038776 RepID=A0A7M2YCI0_9FLAO|nr:tellurite resistance/C4-dicarboxylate transporter family protein [Kaistella flava (ex Peng et al. 2021)]QOW11831.1 C4-dicarboxylate ABC transporter [Kaistella flava (ex Peng et al. 2021)]